MKKEAEQYFTRICVNVLLKAGLVVFHFISWLLLLAKKMMVSSIYFPPGKSSRKVPWNLALARFLNVQMQTERRLETPPISTTSTSTTR